ncbi:hypothetical protein SLEP1_g17682 [Rubroshorea leprosula]|uniref:Uncharacterized protein n=1 Tax=Rubroshorea leprosula TaxID=152421 RepID=A0AAV5J3Y9_9ROSI|nr:hypothetical protein SLEP1_g17682 [Rubroshorea leprosula]
MSILNVKSLMVLLGQGCLEPDETSTFDVCEIRDDLAATKRLLLSTDFQAPFGS